MLVVVDIEVPRFWVERIDGSCWCCGEERCGEEKGASGDTYYVEAQAWASRLR
jgi:hypothetical protein